MEAPEESVRMNYLLQSDKKESNPEAQASPSFEIYLQSRFCEVLFQLWFTFTTGGATRKLLLERL